jgi:hypothetical protein
LSSFLKTNYLIRILKIRLGFGEYFPWKIEEELIDSRDTVMLERCEVPQGGEAQIHFRKYLAFRGKIGNIGGFGHRPPEIPIVAGSAVSNPRCHLFVLAVLCSIPKFFHFF